jgi:hypothetical protein
MEIGADRALSPSFFLSLILFFETPDMDQISSEEASGFAFGSCAPSNDITTIIAEIIAELDSKTTPATCICMCYGCYSQLKNVHVYPSYLGEGLTPEAWKLVQCLINNDPQPTVRELKALLIGKGWRWVKRYSRFEWVNPNIDKTKHICGCELEFNC